MRPSSIFALLALLVSLAESAHAQTCTVSPTSGSFPQTPVGDTSTLTFAATNTGTGSLDVADIIESGPNCGDFSVDPTSTAGLGNGASQTFTVTFAPSARGARLCTFTLVDNEAAPNADTFVASGSGTGPSISVSPSMVSLGSVRVSSGSALSLVTVQNLGETTLEFSASVSGQTLDFSIPTTSGVQVDGGGGSTTIPVTFDPTATGTRNAVVTITSNDPASPAIVVPLSGTGTVSTIALTPTGTAAFGSVEAGSTSEVGITVDDAGTASFVVSSMSIVGANAGDFAFASQGCAGQSCDAPFQVDPGADLETVTIRCSPTARGARTALLTFTVDVDSGATTLALACTGLAPVAAPTPSDRQLDFPATDVGGVSELDATIANSGDAPLDILGVEITGADASAFSLVSGVTSSHSLATSASEGWTVRCSPEAAGPASATLAISVDEPTIASPISFDLHCTGVAIDAGVDAGEASPTDAGAEDDAGATDPIDAGSDAGDDHARAADCGCATAGAARGRGAGPLALVAGALALLLIGRRRSRGRASSHRPAEEAVRSSGPRLGAGQTTIQ